MLEPTWINLRATFEDTRRYAERVTFADVRHKELYNGGFEVENTINFVLWCGGDKGALSWIPAIGRAATAAQMLEKCGGANDAYHHLFLIHGFNSTYEDVAEAYFTLYGMLGAFGILADFEKNPGTTIITHSLGARVGCEWIRLAGKRVQNLILLAPALDDEALASGHEFSAVPGLVDNVYVFHSRRDLVLREAYRFSIAPDHSPLDYALGERGRDPAETYAANVYAVDCTRVVGSHGGYRSAPEVIDAIGAVVRGELKGDLVL